MSRIGDRLNMHMKAEPVGCTREVDDIALLVLDCKHYALVFKNSDSVPSWVTDKGLDTARTLYVSKVVSEHSCICTRLNGADCSYP